jgi:hypothetical protein
LPPFSAPLLRPPSVHIAGKKRERIAGRRED